MAVVLDLVNNPRPRHPEKAHRPDSAQAKKPDWIRVKAPVSPGYFATQKIMRDNGLHTVCEEAGCPNIGECWEKKHATFMIMGDTCTRACAFCNVKTGLPGALDRNEPAHVADATAKLAEEKERLVKLEQRWKTEKALVDDILATRAKLRGVVGKVEGTQTTLEQAADASAKSVSIDAGPKGAEATPPAESAEKLLATLRELQSKLTELQGEQPLILPSVDAQAVASVVADWTGIPVGRMVKNEVEAVLKLGDTLNDRVIGQRLECQGDVVAAAAAPGRAPVE